MASLDLDLTEEQTMLREAVQRLIDDVAQPSWDDLADRIGLAGLTIPQGCGGFGGGMLDLAVVMAELGPALAGADWLMHGAACHLLGDHAAVKDLGSGSRRATVICTASAASLPHVTPGGRIEGSARLVAGGCDAAIFLVVGPGGSWLVSADAPGLGIEALALHDGTRVADLHFAGVSAERLGDDGTSADAVIRTGRCAEAVGLMQRMLADTADFISQRRQFGVPIASFQVLRHRLANMQLAAMQAQALTEAAIGAQQGRVPDRDIALAAAVIAVRDAAREVGEGAVQLHGAMGLTDELRLGARFKRLLAIAAGFGSQADALDRFAVAERMTLA